MKLSQNQKAASPIIIIGGMALAIVSIIAIIVMNLPQKKEPTALPATSSDPAIIQSEIKEREKVFRDTQGCQSTDLAGCDEEGEWFQIPSQ